MFAISVGCSMVAPLAVCEMVGRCCRDTNASDHTSHFLQGLPNKFAHSDRLRVALLHAVYEVHTHEVCRLALLESSGDFEFSVDQKRSFYNHF